MTGRRTRDNDIPLYRYLVHLSSRYVRKCVRCIRVCMCVYIYRGMARSTIGRARLVLFPRSKAGGEFRVMLRPKNGFTRTVPLAECSSRNHRLPAIMYASLRGFVSSSNRLRRTLENVRTVRNKKLFGIKANEREYICICKCEE